MLNPATVGPVDRDVGPILTRLQADRVENGAPVAGRAVEAGARDGLPVLDYVHIHPTDLGTRLIDHFHVTRPDPSELTADHRQSDHDDNGGEPFPGRGGPRDRMILRHLNRGYGEPMSKRHYLGTTWSRC